MTTHPASHDLVKALRVAADALKPIADMVFNDNGDLTVSPEPLDYDQIVAAWRAESRARRFVAALASEAASQVPADGWRPIVDADLEIATIQTFGELVLQNSHPAWVRDEDGRTYEAVWTVPDRGRMRGVGYWWDIEGESPVSPVEIYPHPLSAAPDHEGPADGK